MRILQNRTERFKSLSRGPELNLQGCVLKGAAASGFKVSGAWRVTKEGCVKEAKSGNQQNRIATPGTALNSALFLWRAPHIFGRADRTDIDPSGAILTLVGIMSESSSLAIGRGATVPSKDGAENALQVYHNGILDRSRIALAPLHHRGISHSRRRRLSPAAGRRTWALVR